MNELRLCRDCKWGLERKADWLMLCCNPIVNKNDPWALAAKGPLDGTGCLEERQKGWLRGICGKRGAKWEPK